jgi:hypothetical protein
MVRKTIGRSGRIIEVPDGSAGQTIGIVEADERSIPVEFAGTSSMEDVAGSDRSDPTESQPDFEPVGEVIRTEPIASEPDSKPGPGFFDPATSTGTRTRKPRGPNKPKEPKPDKSFITANLEKVLYQMHQMAAKMLAEPLLEIDEDESKLLAEGIEKVANAYNWTTVLSAKQQAALDMAIALGTVYGMRVLTIMKRQRRPMRNVTPIDQTGTESK